MKTRGVKVRNLSMQALLADITENAATDLIAALESLPPERRDWQPAPAARSALDMVAECAVLNGNTADLIAERRGKPASYAQEYTRLVAALRTDEAAARALLTTNTARAIEGIRSVPGDEFSDAIPLPWGSITLQELIVFPYWNMTYHLGQIRYIASLPGESAAHWSDQRDIFPP